MSEAHLRFSTDILRRLGEELNPSPDQGVLELVKNSYDANALSCEVEIDLVSAGGLIRVSDDGDGMNRQGIHDGWLVLGKSSKKTSEPTRLGRLPAGNKGLGRLAALRMGSSTTLVSRPRGDAKSEFTLKISWDAFTEHDVVEEVPLEIAESVRARGVGQGTVVTIDGLHSKIGRNEVKKLARSLLLLADPFNDNPSGFRPSLKASEFKDLEALVKNRYFDDAEYHLVATVDANGLASATVTDYRGQELFTAGHADLRQKQEAVAYQCPPARFDLWVFILTKESFDMRSTTVSEVQAWLGEFGGVHLYSNGLRVSPYGNPGNDWLDLNLSRVRSPELRPGTNTSIGRVSVDDRSSVLIQKTDRSGFVENNAFNDLKLFASDALDWMARRRLGEREQRRATDRVEAPTRVEKAKETFAATIERLPPRAKSRVRKRFEQYNKARDRETRDLRKEVQLYRTLSTAGITAAVFAHESKHPLQLITRNVRQIERRALDALKTKYQSILGGAISRLSRSADAIQAFGNLTLNMVSAPKRRMTRVEIHGTMRHIEKTFQPFIQDRKVEASLELDPSNPYLRASEAAIESVLINLLTNALNAFLDAPPGPRKLVLRTRVIEKLLTLTVSDNGPGIEGIGLKDIWLPGQTTSPTGTGLGLTIVRDSVKDLGGSVDAVSHGELGGAEFTIKLPILGA